MTPSAPHSASSEVVSAAGASAEGAARMQTAWLATRLTNVAPSFILRSEGGGVIERLVECDSRRGVCLSS